MEEYGPILYLAAWEMSQDIYLGFEASIIIPRCEVCSHRLHDVMSWRILPY